MVRSFSKVSVLLLLLVVAVTAAAPADDLLGELRSLRSRSPTGVIHLTDALVARFLVSSPKPRRYSLVVFFDAAKLHDRSELHLQKLRSEFGIVSASFSANNASPTSSDLFFCDLEFGESQHAFSQFGVNSLPHIRFIGPSGGLALAASEAMDQSTLAGKAESMAEYIEEKTGLRVRPIHRPPPISTTHVVIFLVFVAICAPFAIRRVLAGDTLLNDRRFWAAGAVFVYFFSVSGAMHNVIRQSPMVLTDQQGQVTFFYRGSGMQLGAEGFVVGFLYTMVGLLVASITHLLVRVNNVTAQKGLMLVALAASAWAVKQVVYLDNWKTGYNIHPYWPTRWR